MAVKNTVNASTRIAFGSAGILPIGFQPINPGGFDGAIFLLRIVNASNQPIDISYDGIREHDYVPANSTLQLNFQTNSQPNNYIAKFKKGAIVYLDGTPGIGTIYLIGYYQEEG